MYNTFFCDTRKVLGRKSSHIAELCWVFWLFWIRSVSFRSFPVSRAASAVRTRFSRVISEKIYFKLHATWENIIRSTDDWVRFRREKLTWTGENRFRETRRYRSNLTARSVRPSVRSSHVFLLPIRFRLLLRKNEGIFVLSFELPGRREFFDDVTGMGGDIQTGDARTVTCAVRRYVHTFPMVVP